MGNDSDWHGGANGLTIVTTTADTLGLQINSTNYTLGIPTYLDKWTHIVFTLDFSGNQNWYADTVQIVTDSDISAKTMPTETTCYMLKSPDMVNYKPGDGNILIDDFRIYNRILSSTEITNLFNGNTASGYLILNLSSLADANIMLLDDNVGDSQENIPDIFIKQEELLRIDSFNGKRSETFTVDVTALIENYDINAPYLIKGVMREIDKLLDTESRAHTSYFYKLRYNWLGSYRIGQANLVVEVHNHLVTRPALL